MGLIKSNVDAIGSTLHDEWKEVIRCEEMSNEILMVKSSNQNGVISNGSTIIVAPNQCAAIAENGKIIDATAENGIFIFDKSSTPSFLGGQFKSDFKKMWMENTYDLEDLENQYVVFFNLNDIKDNKFGTKKTITYIESSKLLHGEGADQDRFASVKIHCSGKYTFKISNPALFLREIARTAEVYRKGRLNDILKTEVIETLQKVLNELADSEEKISATELPSQTNKIKEIMEEKVFDESIRKMGLQLVEFNIETVSIEEIHENISEVSAGIIAGGMGDSIGNIVSDAVGEVVQDLPETELSDSGLSVKDNQEDDELAFEYERNRGTVAEQLESLFADEPEQSQMDNELAEEENEEFDTNIDEYDGNEDRLIEDSEEDVLSEYVENDDGEYDGSEENFDEQSDDSEEIGDEEFDDNEEIDDEEFDEARENDNAEINNVLLGNESEEAEEDLDEDENKIQGIENEPVGNEIKEDVDEPVKNEREEGDKLAEKINQVGDNEEKTFQLIDFESMSNNELEEAVIKQEISEVDEFQEKTPDSKEGMAKMCLRCGTINIHGTKFCSGCGNEL